VLCVGVGCGLLWDEYPPPRRLMLDVGCEERFLAVMMFVM
jgi:hypothetical protein